MAGFDKFVLMKKLVALGWEETDWPGCVLKPPESLWKDSVHSYDVYDARTLQMILGDSQQENLYEAG